MEETYASVLARSDLCRTEQRTVLPVSTSPVASPSSSSSDLYGGSFHRVPEGFTLPSGTLRVTWQHWCAGIPPLRLLSKSDMATRVTKVRLAELQQLMRYVEALLSEE
jgi:hypothetical protein